MNDFSGRSVLVTGAAGGLGRAVAMGFARGGAHLTLVDVEAGRLAEVVDAVAAAGGKAHPVVADISDRQSCRDAVEEAAQRYGRLDVLCNIAATLRFHKVADVTEADWRRILDVNVTGAFFLSQAAIPHLLKCNGNIVNAVSPAAAIGHPFLVPYSVSKAALLQMTRSMAMEFIKQPIRINAVMPGPMNTAISQGFPFP